MTRIAIPIETEELCHYGCNNTAKFKNGSNNLMCLERSSSCPAVRGKNKEKLKEKHADVKAVNGKYGLYDYDTLPQETKDRMNWNKGNYSNVEFIYNGSGNHKAALLVERGHKCEECKLSLWNGKSIPIELEHTDGDNKNNVRENLRLLCCNCHALTPTWRRRKDSFVGNCKYTDEEMILAITTSNSFNEALNKLGLKWGSNSTLKRVMHEYNIGLMPAEVKLKTITPIKEKKPTKEINKKNSQYGTCWVCNIEQKINKKIKKNELSLYLNNGWFKGRSMLFGKK